MIMIFSLWILIGSLVGVIANYIETPFNAKDMITSIALGIAGASFGGIMGSTFIPSTGIGLLPFLYIISGAFIVTMIPTNSNNI
jgi:uncharacterized membrane protein YeaQ/YmgE (transglycosylase-associated protein family)